MISNLNPDDRRYLDRQMKRYLRRQARRLQWELAKSIGAPILAIACLIMALYTFWPGNKPEPGPKTPRLNIDTTSRPVISREILREYDSIIRASLEDSLIKADSEIVVDKNRYRYHEGHIIAMQPNPTWFWIVLDSPAWRASRWRKEKPKYPAGTILTMTKYK